MPYIGYIAPAMPYHLDGTVVKWISANLGVLNTLSAAQTLELNDEDYTVIFLTAISYPIIAYLTFFFPELVDVEAVFVIGSRSYLNTSWHVIKIEWSSNTTNGLDGTWFEVGCPAGYNAITTNFDSWRRGFVPITGANGANSIRMHFEADYPRNMEGMKICHLYGHKTYGQTPDDILFLDAEAGDMEFPVPLEFGDLRTNTFLVRQIKVKNSSATLTANAIVLTVLDPSTHITISVDNVNYGTTENVGNLAPGASSVVYYVKCSLGVAPQPLGPDRAPISAEVTGGWS